MSERDGQVHERRHVSMVVKGEGLTRLEAERRLVRLYKQEYERVARKHGHVDALRSLVRDHKERYNTVVRQVREERELPRPA
jgi:hypothetical protein